jgi:hypothetical protein
MSAHDNPQMNDARKGNGTSVPIPLDDNVQQGRAVEPEAATGGSGQKIPPVSPATAAPDPTPNVSRRASIAELDAAAGDQSAGVTLGEVEVKYEHRQKLRPVEYIRVHPDKELWQEIVALIDEEGMEKTLYFISQAMQPKLREWLRRVLLVPCINQDNEYFIWEIPMADMALGQRQSASERVKLQAVQAALAVWHTVLWDGKKHVLRPADEDGKHLGEPKWPEGLTRSVLNQRAYQDHYIGSLEHSIAQHYTGRGRK